MKWLTCCRILLSHDFSGSRNHLVCLSQTSGSGSESRRLVVGLIRSGFAEDDPGYMSRKILKFRTNQFDT